MAGDNVHYDVEEELEHLRGEVRALREEQERQKQQPQKPEQANKDDEANKKESDQEDKKEPPKSHFLRNIIIIAAVLVVLLIAGVIWWLHARRFESTDDAQVDDHLDTLTARIAGTITGVYAEENQTVKQGQLLVDLDRRDYNAAADLARSQLLLAQAQTRAEQPNVPVTDVTNKTNIASTGMDITRAQAGVAAADRNYAAALAKVREAEANNVKAQADIERYRPLADKDEIPREQFDQVIATAKASAATVAANQESAQAAQKMADQSRAELAQAEERANQATKNAPDELAIRQANVAARTASAQGAQAQLEQALLNLSYTKILAPVNGIVAKRVAEIGQHVTPGQQVFLITQTDDMWVTANYKETQLLRMHPGQSVRIHVDALGKDYDGYLESLPGASGSVTSLLPPENATGNFVKVVQRLPVRIRFKKDQDGLDRLRPGMSVEPDVQVR
jgi:membrane fusion protein (multidrug efflux system)